MGKTFKEVAHLYLGCAIKAGHGTTLLCSVDLIHIINETLSVMPILYRLEDMTEEDKEQIGFAAFGILRNETKELKLPSKNISCIWAARQTSFLLSKHYDLFNLIDNGQAIDYKTFVK